MTSFWGKLRVSRSSTKHQDDKTQIKVHLSTIEPSPDELLDRLPPVYFDLDTTVDKRKQHPSIDDPLGAELKLLKLDFTADDLDALAEERTMAFEAVSERLTQHISARSSQLQQGSVGVADIQEDLASTCLKIKQTRSILALTSASVGKALKITDQNKKKDELRALLSSLQSIREVVGLQSAAKSALEEGQYSDALWLSMRSMYILEEDEAVKEMNIALRLVARAEELYGVIVDSLHSALNTLCSNVDPDICLRVVQGYAFLNDQELLRTVVKDVFSQVADIMPISIVRGNVLSYSDGDSDEASKALTLKELANMLHADQFLQAYSQVLLVFWNIFACYRKLYRQLKQWHTAAVDSSTNTDDGTKTSKEHVENDYDNINNNEGEDIRGGIQPHIWQEALAILLESMDYFPKSLWTSEMTQTIVTLLSAPAATEKHHFLTVLIWTNQMMAAGEAFSNSPRSHVLDIIMHRQVTRYLLNVQSGNIEAMILLLDRETWDALPVGLPSCSVVVKKKNGSSGLGGGDGNGTSNVLSSTSTKTRQQSFDEMMKVGNPWEPASSSSSSCRSEVKVAPKSVPSPPPSPSSSIVTTTTSLKMMQWITDYLRSLPSMPASALPTLRNNISELIELFIMYVYIQFGGQPLEEALKNDDTRGGGVIHTTTNKLPRCLYAVLKEAAGQSLVKYAGLLCNGEAAKSVLGSALLKYNKTITSSSPTVSSPMAASIGDGCMLCGGSSSNNNNNSISSSGSGVLHSRAPLSSTTGGTSSVAIKNINSASALSNQGNLFGLQARCVATGSLLHVMHVLNENHNWLFTPSADSNQEEKEENNDTDHNYKTLALISKAVEELQHHVLTEAIYLLLPLRWLSDSIATTNYNIEEVPVEPDPSWLPKLESEMQLFTDRLQAIAPLLGDNNMDNNNSSSTSSCIHIIKCLTVKYVGRLILNGLARVSVCTLEGRNSMMLTLQSVTKTIGSMLASSSSHTTDTNNASSSTAYPPKKTAFSKETVNIQLSFVDGYIKGFFLPVSEIPEWARQHHDEYTLEQVVALTSCMAGSRGLGAKDKQALLAQIEGSLRALYRSS
jgi:hypothetical protein